MWCVWQRVGWWWNGGLGGLLVAVSPDEHCCAGSPGLVGMDREVSQKGTGPQKMESLRATSHLLARETEAQGGIAPRSGKLRSAHWSVR